MMFRRPLGFVAASVALLATGCVAQTRTLTILHTNDIHASFVPHEAFWVRSTPRPAVGGFVELEAAVDSIRHADPSVLLLDAGDVMTGNPITDLSWRGAEGGWLFELMNRVGYECWTPGNHDFDISEKNCEALMQIAAFPVVSANLHHPDGTHLGKSVSAIVVVKDGLRIGIVGWMSPQFYGLVNQHSRADVTIDTSVRTFQSIVDSLRGISDIVVALTHQGVDEDSLLATRVHGVDLIVGGHSHTRLKRPVTVNGIPIAQAGSNLENLGILKLTVDNGHLASVDGSLLQLWSHPDRPHTPLALLVDSLQGVLDRQYAEVIGTLITPWVRGNGESNIGDYITDAQRRAVNADVAFTNTHGIRKDLPAGPITRRDLFEVLPFRNILVTFDLTGAQIRSIVRRMIGSGNGQESVQTSGIVCEWKKTPGGAEIVRLDVNGAPLDDAKVYTGAANDYMMGESSRYLGLPTPKLTFTSHTLFEVVERSIRSDKTIDAKVENRFRRIDP